MSDLISRQAAIDALCNYYCGGHQDCKYYPNCENLKTIEQLPSAQPDIIRCKDCKHHWTHGCMDSMPIERCDLGQTFYDAEVDFCSLAERREVTT